MGREFKKSERLLKRKDFLIISRTAEERVKTKNFLILIKKNRQASARLGITVSKKVGNAVVRNRLKRYVREYFRTNKQNVPPGRDMVIIARQGSEKLTCPSVMMQLGAALERPKRKNGDKTV